MSIQFVREIGIRLVNKRRRQVDLYKCSYCDEEIVLRRDIAKGYTSCGCRKGYNIRNITKDNISHGMSRSKVYRVWRAMLARCNDPKDVRFHCYGGRGITVDPKWNKFEGFWEDMRNGYSPGLTLERIDVNKGYNKTNCCWIPAAQQARNRTNVKMYKLKGENKTLVEISREHDIPESTLRHRLEVMKLPVNKAITYGTRP